MLGALACGARTWIEKLSVFEFALSLLDYAPSDHLLSLSPSFLITDLSMRLGDPKISDKALQEEYFRLGQATRRTEDHMSAILPCNKTKNRYTDVLPLESTRIKLAPRANEPGSDYINANQVTDPTPASHDNSTNDNYICAQAPLQNTLNDFWRMVWEQVRHYKVYESCHSPDKTFHGRRVVRLSVRCCFRDLLACPSVPPPLALLLSLAEPFLRPLMTASNAPLSLF